MELEKKILLSVENFRRLSRECSVDTFKINGIIKLLNRQFTHKSHGIILPLLWASTDYSYFGIFRNFYFCLLSLDVAALFKDSHASVKQFVSNLRC